MIAVMALTRPEQEPGGAAGGWRADAPQTAGGLHRSVIDGRDEIRQLLERMVVERRLLTRALNRKTMPESALVERVGDSELSLRTHDFEPGARGPWRLSGVIDGTPFFFHASILDVDPSGRARAALPTAIYRTERRERSRTPAGRDRGPTRVRVSIRNAFEGEGEVEDFSPVGLGLRIRSDAGAPPGDTATIEYLDGVRTGAIELGTIRSSSTLSPGWKRLGVSLLGTDGPMIEVERRDTILGESRLARARTQLALAASAVRAGVGGLGRLSRRRHREVEVRTVEYENRAGERLVGILDTCGEAAGAPVVVIPPAWGKTKETLLPLAATILACFERWRRPVSVLRFDGVRRRGESFNEPECRVPGKEYLRFAFSQGVRDIQATLDFLFGEANLHPSAAILVSFSAAAVDTRRAVAIEQDDRIGGWISVVGAPDLQGAMKVVSGGLDYVAGFERGIRFGRQEIQGVLVDMDFAASDALEARLAFLDDALGDMRAISQPTTWIHGRFDAWMDLERVRLLMSAGSQARRRLIEVPTGHQLRSSVEALEVFQLIAAEVARFAGFEVDGRAVPDAASLRRRAEAERSRLPKRDFRPREFWRDYLVGRDGKPGMELMIETSAYQEFLAQQTRALELESGDRLLDLGSGTGSVSEHLVGSRPLLELRVTELDLVPEALVRARERRASAGRRTQIRVASVVCDLSGRGRAGIPLADSTQDAAVASLLLSYLPEPERLIREVRRVLRPGGRLVVSSLRPDADTSRIWEAGASELVRRQASLGPLPRVDDLGAAMRSFLNSAARLLDLEEQRVFRFFDEDELRGLVEGAGFEVLEVSRAFGTPPQALILAARKTQEPTSDSLKR